MKRHGAYRRMIESMVITLVVMLTFGGTGVLAQMRIVDQGNKPWSVYLCDTSGTNCVGTETTGTPGVYRLLTSTGGGGGGGTVAQGTNGSAAAPWYVTFTSGTVTVTNTVAVTGTVTATPTGTQAVSGTVTSTPSGTTTITGTVSATSGTINSMPSVSVTSGTINSSTISQIPSLTVTSGTIGLITMPSLTVTSGTIGSLPSVSVTSGTIGSITMPSLTVTSGTIGLITMPSLTVTSGTIGNTVTISPTGTQSINVAQVLGAALTTANPMINGGRASTDTTASVADGVARALRLDKFGDVVFVVAPPDMQTSVRTNLTATTISSVISAPGAAYKYAVTFMSVCNLSATIAGQVDITDSSGTLYSFPWTQTSSAPGEARCVVVNLGNGDPIYTVANSSISAKASVANGTGFAVNIAAHKTGT